VNITVVLAALSGLCFLDYALRMIAMRSFKENAPEESKEQIFGKGVFMRTWTFDIFLLKGRFNEIDDHRLRTLLQWARYVHILTLLPALGFLLLLIIYCVSR